MKSADCISDIITQGLSHVSIGLASNKLLLFTSVLFWWCIEVIDLVELSCSSNMHCKGHQGRLWWWSFIVLPGIQEKLGIINKGVVYAVFDYRSQNPDELDFRDGDGLTVLRKGDEQEKDWWWARRADNEGYIPRNLLGVSVRLVGGNPVASHSSRTPLPIIPPADVVELLCVWRKVGCTQQNLVTCW